MKKKTIETSFDFVNMVKTEVSKFYHVPIDQLDSVCRLAEVAFARQVLMYLLYQNCAYPYLRIARLLGMHHTTVMYAVNRIDEMIGKDKILKAEIRHLSKKIIKLINSL